jgi:glutamine amidotransferase
MKTAIIDYGSGNLRSAANAVERAGRELNTPCDVVVTSQPEDVRSADRIVLPGVGSFADCRRGLSDISGLEDALIESVITRGRPFLGICVGMQLMADFGLEKARTAGLGWISGDVNVIQPSDPALKVPHMGWNTLTAHRPHPVLADMQLGPDGQHAYFVHSYQLQTAHRAELIATTQYGGSLTAMVGRDNMIGTQFHPEKSQALGLKLISNFLNWRP